MKLRAIEKIRRYDRGAGFNRGTVVFRVIKQSFVFRCLAFQSQPDDDDVNMGLASRFAAPGKSPMRKGYLEIVALEKQWPQLGDLLALSDRVGRNKSNLGRSVLYVRPGLDEPGGHIVEA